MLAALPFLAIEFVARTVVLLGLLWLMVKLQKFDRRYEYRFTGLIGVALLASGLDMVPFGGHFLAVPVLLVGVKKVTHADYIESLLTITISYALILGVNLILMGSFMGDLRTRIENANVFRVIRQPRLIYQPGKPDITNANPQALQTNQPVPRPDTNQAKPVLTKPVPATVPKTNPPVQTTNQPPPGAPTRPAPPPQPTKPTESLAKYFSVKGVTRNGANSAVTIQTGTRVYTIFLEESALMQTTAGPISVRFAELTADSVTLEINGESVKYQLH
jgi:hypothetical protein